MKKIQIKGGLGNQMFQYAYGRNLMLNNKKDIIFDISFFDKVNTKTPRDFLLKNFNIPTEITFMSLPDNFYQNFIKKILKKINFNFEEYFQGENYFEKIKDTIEKEFALTSPFSSKAVSWREKINNTNNSTSIHVRRTDYVDNPLNQKIYVNCSQKYYQNAILLIKEKCRNKETTFFIFSDDIKWVKENLKFKDAEYVSDQDLTECEEMFLMSTCKHNIIANSTFSWWGAWLNKNPNKIIIAPKNWFKNKKSNVVPESWITL